MAENSHIGWTTHTFNPWHGCQKVSPGCSNCYMEAWKKRIGQLMTDRRRTVDWKKPLKWDRDFARWRDQPCAPHLRPAVEEHAKRNRPRIFPSLCDWLDGEVPIEWLADFLKLIHDTPNLDWLLLTKRPENCLDHLAKALKYAVFNASRYMAPSGFMDWLDAWHEGKPPTNVWLGVSVENQRYADIRRDVFRSIPARTKFVSYEPALGHVTWTGWEFVNQIIFGGESGNDRRNCEIDWAGSTQAFCIENQIAFFCKQDAHRFPGQQGRLPKHIWDMKQIPAFAA